MTILIEGYGGHERRTNEDEIIRQHIERHGNISRAEVIGPNHGQIQSNERSFTHKKVKRAIATPKNNELVSPLRQYVGPSTAGREEHKK